MSNAAPWPVRLRFEAGERRLLAAFDDGVEVAIPFELLRVESPSAEVQGHGPHQKKLVPGKRAVQVVKAEPVGRYAVRLTFDDGHSSGIYSWRYLRELGEDAQARLSAYAGALEAAGLSRD